MTDINPDDIRVCEYSAKNTTWTNRVPSGIRIIHVPTGIEVVCDEHRSQHLNRDQALNDLRMRLNGQF